MDFFDDDLLDLFGREQIVDRIDRWFFVRGWLAVRRALRAALGLLLLFEFRDELGGLEAGELTVFDQDARQGFRGDTDLGLLDHFLEFDDALGVQEAFVFEHLNELRCAHGLLELLDNRDT